MTEYNFIAMHYPSGQENQSGTLHLNINEVPGTSQGIISSMIIHVNAFSIDGATDADSTYIESVLEQIETVGFRFNGIQYNLVIVSPTFYPAANPFFYYTVEPAYIPDIYDNAILEASIEDITFTPYLLDLQFGFSVYNPLISNASEGRKSTLIMESDRLEQTVLPSNIDALLEESAIKASIQDSMYYDTGWSNSRYVGSVTSADESAGIPPTLSGRSFIGESFPADSDTDYICKLDNRISQNFFHTADDPLPTFSPDDRFAITLGNSLGSLQTEFSYTTISGSLSIGDVVRGHPIVQSIPDGEGGNITTVIFEYMKVVGIILNNVTVERDIYNLPDTVTIPTYNQGVKLTKVARYDIFRFEDTGQTKIQLVNNSRIYVNGNNSIIDTDDYGQVVSSSICVRFLAEIDTD
jgi:hypothetical protein